MKILNALTFTLSLILASGEILEKCENPEEESAAEFDFGQALSLEVTQQFLRQMSHEYFYLFFSLSGG